MSTTTEARELKLQRGDKDNLNYIREASKDGKLIFCFVGVGSASAKENYQSSLILAKDGVTMLVDIGFSIPRALYDYGINILDLDYYHFTHSHGDHIGGAEELLINSRYQRQVKPKVIITRQYHQVLWDETLRGGLKVNETGALSLDDYIEPIYAEWKAQQPREMYEVNIGTMNLLLFRTNHVPGGCEDWQKAYWSTGLLVDGKVLFSGDTRFDPNLFKDLPMEKVRTIFHDCQLFEPGAVHATYNQLKGLDPELKRKMYLYHYGDNFGKFDPRADGFAGFTEQMTIYKPAESKFPNENALSQGFQTINRAMDRVREKEGHLPS
jgi:ribonuclease BN (tRNA processing enzyme)